jgi:predicted RNA binding protein YcfA (HicA-like mRNA interferase family)
MGKLAPLSARKLIQKLKKASFVETHQRGSHLYLESRDGEKIVTVPIHGSKDIPIGTLYNIVVKQAGFSAEEFQDLWLLGILCA